MTTPLMLNGHTDDREAKLLNRIAELERRVVILEGQQSKSKEDAVVGLLNLLGHAMREIASGHIDLSAVPVPATGDASAMGRVDKWQGIKQRFGGKEAELIEILLTCGPRTNTQLKPLLKLGYSTVCTLTLKMSNMGFLTKVGEAWGLKD